MEGRLLPPPAHSPWKGDRDCGSGIPLWRQKPNRTQRSGRLQTGSSRRVAGTGGWREQELGSSPVGSLAGSGPLPRRPSSLQPAAMLGGSGTTHPAQPGLGPGTRACAGRAPFTSLPHPPARHMHTHVHLNTHARPGACSLVLALLPSPARGSTCSCFIHQPAPGETRSIFSFNLERQFPPRTLSSL